MRREDSGKRWSGWRILNVRGRSCFSAQGPDAILRTVPPSQSAQYAAGHDMGMRRAMETVLGSVPGTVELRGWAHQLATLPMRLGGLGLRSASRMALAAFWASWADALPMLSARLPELTDRVVEGLSTQPRGCLAQLYDATMVTTSVGHHRIEVRVQQDVGRVSQDQQHAPTQADYGCGQEDQKEPWPVQRPGPRCDATQSCAI